MRIRPLLLIFSLLLVCAAPCLGQQERDISRQQREEEDDYFKKWLEQDVGYIISEEEKAVFKALSTAEEKEQFIEQFWFRRDPDPLTAENETKEEHYRRLAYVNERFGSGVPGWKTDRGRIYITFGPPDIIEDHPSGGWYQRKRHEGGGFTSTFPFQLWIYNDIEGLGQEVEIEFVDPSWAGEYEMALTPDEKDALFHVGGMGPTDLELEGVLNKRDRPYFSPANYTDPTMQAKFGMRAKDKPFERIHRFYALQKPEPIQYLDLKQLVEVDITYEDLPYELNYHYLTIDEGEALVPITLEVNNSDLSFNPGPLGPDQLRGELGIYGMIQSMSGRPLQEFDDSLVLEFPAHQLEIRQQRRSTYQKVVLLPPGRYKLTLVVKDESSGHTGVKKTGLIIPAPPAEGLSTSSLILARSVQALASMPDQAVPFVLGHLKVVPNVTATFNRRDPLGFYLQLYNAGLDQTTLAPSLDVEYQIIRDGKIVKRFLDPKHNSVLDYGDRFVLVQAFGLEDLDDGTYELHVTVHDRIADTELERQVSFDVTG